ncbi:isobutyryl-CoA dehydrogenase [Oceanicaulis sp.]|uniref:isobutyryl-CoA dehydrogenase n=1 Tax=Oceanicaulis sp. TaxID=1924941 RepID=UPI003F730F6A
MHFELTEEQALIQDAARKFAEDRLKPHAAEWDETKHFPVDVLKESAAMGFAGIYTRDDVGGSGMSRVDAALIFEQLSRGCVSTAAFISIHNMVSWMIDSWGSEEQRQRWLPDLTAMNTIASYCLTEPGAGSDAANLRTKAVRDGDHYVLNGSKAFISGAGTSDLYAVMCRTGEDGPKGISTIIVEKDTPGLSFGANERKMGWNSQPTRVVTFEDCRVPVENRIGEEGQGFGFAMQGLNGGRINIGACSLGGAAEAVDLAIQYAKERSQFGRHIADFQATQFKLADMVTELDASRMMLLRAADAVDRKDPQAAKYCAMAKRFSTDMGFKIANDALQIHGGYGYLKDYPLERIVRDLRVHQILEGTNEIMRVIIAKDVLR